MADNHDRISLTATELAELKLSAQQQLLDQIPEMVITVDGKGLISGYNNAALVELGVATEGTEGEPLSTLFDEETGTALFALCIAGFKGVGDSEVQLRDGRAMSFAVRRMNETRSYVVLRDVSRRDHLEGELRHARRMASVGRLAGEVAHEINNPLAVIQGRLEMLRAVPEMPVSSRQRHLQIIEDQASRVARIIKSLQLFAQPRSPQPEHLDLKACLETALKTAGRRMDRVSVDLDLPDSIQVYCDKRQSDLVWENLLYAVVNITPVGEKLRVGASTESSGEVRVRVESPGGAWSPEMLTDFRSPYAGFGYRLGPGHGLSLAIAWGIVQEHGGWMTADNGDGAGATVELTFPGPVGKEQHVVASSGAVRSRDFLVVDDDQVMGETIRWMLSTHGHRAVVVQSAEKALERLSNEVFDVLITDQRLPGMDGEALLEIVHKEWPDMRESSILTSGLLHRPKDGQLYLQKPFSRDQLGQLLKVMF